MIIAIFAFLGINDCEVGGNWIQNLWWSYRDPAGIILLGYLISVWVGGVLVRMLLDSLGPTGVTDQGLRNAGKRIGQFERFLVTTLTILDQYSAIAFVFAAKSIARFKKMDDPAFAEYYLAGTLASVSFGILMGLVIKGGLALVGRGG